MFKWLFDHINVKDASRKTGIPYTTLIYWVEQGKLTGIRKGRDIWVDEDELARVAADWKPRKRKEP